MKVFMIGGTGFIGRHVVTELARAGHEVIVLHRGKTRLAVSKGVTEVLGERSTLEEVGGQIRTFAPDVVVDMILSSAAQARATLRAFHGIACRVVAISSGDVYRATAILHRLESGPMEPVPVTEGSRLRTQTQAYSPEALAAARKAFPWIDKDHDKVKVEGAISSDPALPATILRLPMVYGPGDPLHRLHPTVKRILDGRPAIVYEESYARWVTCPGYVDNVAHAIALATVSDAGAGRIYNVAERDPFTEGEWAAKAGAMLGWSGRVIAVPKHQTPAHLLEAGNLEQHLFVDSSRIRAELGYTEPVSVDEALRRTIEWEQANPPAGADPAKFNYRAEDEAIARMAV
jgi:nucleoside-diphosphate-sugar epimerase